MSTKIQDLIATQKYRSMSCRDEHIFNLFKTIVLEEEQSKNVIKNYFKISNTTLQRIVWRGINNYNFLNDHGNQLSTSLEEANLVEEIKKCQIDHHPLVMEEVIWKVHIIYVLNNLILNKNYYFLSLFFNRHKRF